MKCAVPRIALAVLGFSVLLQAQARPQRVRISEKLSTTLIESKVEPIYPKEARSKHIEGFVVMQAEVTKGGKVEYVFVRSGDPILASAATAAVKKWRYKPFLLNGEAVPFETEVTVTFTLANKSPTSSRSGEIH